MRAITREWLERALDDLKASRALLSHPDLTHLAAFHAQQAVEKALKAAIEEYDLGSHKTHSLAHLLQVLDTHVSVTADLDTLDRLEAVYIEARYPSELGLLPYGKPSSEDAQELLTFAQAIYDQIREALEPK